MEGRSFGQPKAKVERVSLFVTCLVDLLFPDVGLAATQVLERLGVAVDFPPRQTCCGQPAYNSGFHRDAARLARYFIEVFEDSGVIVAPSGSCTYMIKEYYPKLFAGDPVWESRARALSRRVFEFSQFLVDRLGVRDLGARYPGKVAYHDSCHLLRGLGVQEQPRQLLQGVQDLELVTLERSEQCCGFGGTFAVKLGSISEAIADEKIAHLERCGATTLTACDMGCLTHLSGRLSRRNKSIRTVHLAQILAGCDGIPRGETRG